MTTDKSLILQNEPKSNEFIGCHRIYFLRSSWSLVPTSCCSIRHLFSLLGLVAVTKLDRWMGCLKNPTEFHIQSLLDWMPRLGFHGATCRHVSNHSIGQTQCFFLCLIANIHLIVHVIVITNVFAPKGLLAVELALGLPVRQCNDHGFSPIAAVEFLGLSQAGSAARR